MEFRSHRLDNGLEIIAETNEDAHSMSVAFLVRTGSRDESDDVAGVSHFLEHMCFKGTPRRSADDVNREFDEIGAHYNAFTSEECTAYYASLLPEYQEASVDLLADILRPSLRPEDFDMEKKVILEEIQMYLDQPPFGMDDRIKQLHLGGHPLARSVLGTSQSITELAPEQMRNYFTARYSADNVFVAAAGKVDFDALVEQVAARCGDWRPQDAKRGVPPSASQTRFEVVHRPSATQQYVLQLADAPASEDADRYAAKLLATIVGDDSGSRMFWELVDPGLAETASLGHYEYLGVGMFYTWLACEPASIEENLALLSSIFRQIEASGVTDDELRQAKNKVKARVVLSSERPQSRLFSVGGNWLQRREYRTVADDLKALDEVTIDDLHRVLRKYPLSRYTTITVGPRGCAATGVAKPQVMNDADFSLDSDQSRIGVILVDHGSRRDESNALLVDVVRQFTEATGLSIVEPAHMELAEPSIATAFANCVARGARSVVVFPYFLLPGRHWHDDIPQLAAAAARQHPGVRYLVTAPFGLHPLMAEVMRQRIEHCLAHSQGQAAECELCAGTDRCQLRGSGA